MAINPQQMISRAKDILLNPAATWEQVRGEQTTVKDLYLNWIVVGAAISPVCMFLGNMLFGIKIPFTGAVVRMDFASSLRNSITAYIFALIGIYLFALILSKLAPKFGGQDNIVAGLKLVAYSMTPAWLAGSLAIVGNPSLMMLGTLLSLYGFYLMYLGIPVLTGVPSEKRTSYFAVSFVAVVISSMVLAAFSGGMASPTPTPQPAMNFSGPNGEFDAQKFQEGMAQSMQQLQKLAPPDSQ